MLILVRPHASILDGPAVALWLARERNMRNALFAVDPGYARHIVKAPLLKMYGWLVGRHRMVAMDGCRPFALRRVLEDLAAGRNVVIFPQGTGLSDPERPDQPGMGWLLRKIPSVPVVQLYLDHSSLWPSVTVQADHWFTIGKTRDAHVSAGL
ncbi:1-acyl-sn-glycerol-3-phosphate acyltransferase [Acidithiobacillus ferrivorans]|uniref:1-acyl-sn-glycerol-3-phosphate acyltransferase n=1 Tax=Acidithiobacillus ferrivorans TaxID=160808 RepID=A0A7T4WCP3_9PROT|nr:1-acyl-sn-glycerol-3-phosphate acyltransferase [Acidithiobacillus ferrivorans]QQD71975.1 1-acyl-sn-glycerol-3-phosphate acyltransferase [Acidithiobacillus ferrivorans]